jgi:uncharacterized protein (TIGR02466 family)
MNVGLHFVTPLCYKTISIDNAALENYCYKLQKASNAELLPGGWQSGNIDITAIELKPLIDRVKLMVEEVKQLYDFKKDIYLTLENGWININFPGLNQLPDNYYHIHPGYFFSFVYYIKAKKNSGDLKLSSTNGILEYLTPDIILNNFNAVNSSRVLVEPVPGKLIGFPSWMPHHVEPNLSNENRISIAFDCRLHY